MSGLCFNNTFWGKFHVLELKKTSLGFETFALFLNIVRDHKQYEEEHENKTKNVRTRARIPQLYIVTSQCPFVCLFVHQ